MYINHVGVVLAAQFMWSTRDNFSSMPFVVSSIWNWGEPFVWLCQKQQQHQQRHPIYIPESRNTQ